MTGHKAWHYSHLTLAILIKQTKHWRRAVTYPCTNFFNQVPDLSLPRGECISSTQQAFVFLEIRVHFIVQAGLEHVTLLPQPLKAWNYRLSDHI